MRISGGRPVKDKAVKGALDTPAFAAVEQAAQRAAVEVPGQGRFEAGEIATVGRMS